MRLHDYDAHRRQHGRLLTTKNENRTRISRMTQIFIRVYPCHLCPIYKGVAPGALSKYNSRSAYFLL